MSDSAWADAPESVVAFAKAAERYGELQSSEAEPVARWLQQVQRSLLELYRLALDLPPSVEVIDDRRVRVEHEQWLDQFNRIGKAIASADGYWMVYEPFGDPAEPVYASLADDLADVWRDLEEGFRTMRLTGSWRSAAWQWQWGLVNHWGQHAVDAIAIIHH